MQIARGSRLSEIPHRRGKYSDANLILHRGIIIYSRFNTLEINGGSSGSIEDCIGSLTQSLSSSWRYRKVRRRRFSLRAPRVWTYLDDFQFNPIRGGSSARSIRPRSNSRVPIEGVASYRMYEGECWTGACAVCRRERPSGHGRCDSREWGAKASRSN